MPSPHVKLQLDQWLQAPTYEQAEPCGACAATQVATASRIGSLHMEQGLYLFAQGVDCTAVNGCQRGLGSGRGGEVEAPTNYNTQNSQIFSAFTFLAI